MKLLGKHLYLTSECEDRLHISFIYNYISAYVYSDKERDILVEMIEEALVKAKKTQEVQIVDRGGEMCLHITPGGYIKLMLPWRVYQVSEY